MKNWIEAMRLRTLPLSIAGIITGGAMAYHENPIKLNLTVFLLAIVTALLLQILSNFANDYGDFKNGADNENRNGPTRAVLSGAITENAMKKAIVMTSIITLFVGTTLLFFAFKNINLTFIVYFFIGLACIVAAIKYTMGKNPYGYKGLGDIFVFVFFGLVASVGTYFLLLNSISLSVFLPAISIGAWSTAVLNLNNLRDLDNDRVTGKITIPVRIGRRGGIIYHTALISIPFIVNSLYALANKNLLLLVLTGVSLVIAVLIFKPLFKNPSHQILDGLLKKTALFALLFTLLFLIGVCFVV